MLLAAEFKDIFSDRVDKEDCSEYRCFFFVAPGSFWDLSSLTRDGTWALAVKARSPNHWTAREFPRCLSLYHAFYF